MTILPPLQGLQGRLVEVVKAVSKGTWVYSWELLTREDPFWMSFWEKLKTLSTLLVHLITNLY